VFGSLVRGYRVERRRTPDAKPVGIEPVIRIARVLRGSGIALGVIAGIGVAVGILAGSDPEQAVWYAGTPAALIPLAIVHVLRGQRIISLLTRRAATATTDGKGHVFVVRGDRLLGWLVVTPSVLEAAELHAIPPARVHKDS